MISATVEWRVINGDLWLLWYHGQSRSVLPASRSEVETIFPGQKEGSNWQLPWHMIIHASPRSLLWMKETQLNLSLIRPLHRGQHSGRWEGRRSARPPRTVWMAWLQTHGLGWCLAETALTTCHTRNCILEAWLCTAVNSIVGKRKIHINQAPTWPSFATLLPMAVQVKTAVLVTN